MPSVILGPSTPAVCTFCVKEVEKITMEHVFPKSWYPESTPTNAQRPTVPSCEKCNGDLGALENRLRTVMATAVNPGHVAALGVPARAHRSIAPEAASDPREREVRARSRDKLLATMHVVGPGAAGEAPVGPHVAPSWLCDRESGLMLYGFEALPLMRADVDAITVKFTRGMFRYVTEQVLAADVPVQPLVVAQEDTAAAAAKAAVLPGIAGVPPGFICRYRLLDEDPTFSVWYFLVWGQILLSSFVGDFSSVPEVARLAAALKSAK